MTIFYGLLLGVCVAIILWFISPERRQLIKSQKEIRAFADLWSPEQIELLAQAEFDRIKREIESKTT